jgi:hypothetical protein
MSISRSAGYLVVDLGPLRFSFRFENEPADNLTEMMGLGVTGAQEAMAQEKRGSDEQHGKVLDSVATSARTSVAA